VTKKDGEDYGYLDFNKTVDTYITGRGTYEVILKLSGGEFPQAQQHKYYVITRQEKQDANGVVFYNGDVPELIVTLKNQQAKNIYCDGGAEIVKILMEEGLIDEYIISVIPILLGDGKRLFKGGTPQMNVELIESKKFDTGLVQLHYLNLSDFKDD
jgi:dihydrofolate reductase